MAHPEKGITRRTIAAFAGPAAGLAAGAAVGASAQAPADLDGALAGFQIGKVDTLERFAKAAGHQLGSANDQPAFDAAEQAMVAAAAAGSSLYVRIPPGTYRLNRLRLRNRGGYYADPMTVILEQLPAPAGGAPEPFVALADPFACYFLLYNLTLRGGWRFGREGFSGQGGDAGDEADPWLYQPARPGRPETEKPGQTGVQIHGAYSGVDDLRYMKNSPIASQNPRGRIGNLEIEGFGGDGLSIRGAGADLYGGIQIFRIGGRGVVLDSYDLNMSSIDVGETGLEGMVMGPNGSSNRLTPFKIWYSGARRLEGHRAALRLDRCASVEMFGQLQDANGGMIVADGCHGCAVILGVGWQGEIPRMEDDIAALRLNGDVVGNNFIVNLGIGPYANQTYPTVKWLIHTTLDADGKRPRRNNFLLTHEGWSGDDGAWSGKWFEGPLDGNTVIVNGDIRQPGHWGPDDQGSLLFGVRGAGGGGLEAGLQLDTKTEPGAAARLTHPREVRIETQSGGRGGGQVIAAEGLVRLGAPLRLKSYSVATAPSAVAAGAGAAIYLVDEHGGAQGAKSDGRVWRRDSDNAIAKA